MEFLIPNRAEVKRGNSFVALIKQARKQRHNIQPALTVISCLDGMNSILHTVSLLKDTIYVSSRFMWKDVSPCYDWHSCLSGLTKTCSLWSRAWSCI